MKHFLSHTDKHEIAEAIRSVELRTQGELVTVIARQSDQYLYIPTLWATLIALALPGIIEMLAVPDLMRHAYAIQFGSFLLLAVLFRWPPITMRLIPKAVKQQRAHRVAVEQFYRQNLHHTEGRTGVLLFVSVAEHYVEIIADKGINEVVSTAQWDGIVQAFIQRVKAKQVKAGFTESIHAVGAILAQHFPAAPGDRNELPNHLIEL